MCCQVLQILFSLCPTRPHSGLGQLTSPSFSSFLRSCLAFSSSPGPKFPEFQTSKCPRVNSLTDCLLLYPLMISSAQVTPTCKYHPSLPLSSPDSPSQLCAHVPNCHLGISPGIPNKHLKGNRSKTASSLASHPLPPVFLVSVDITPIRPKSQASWISLMCSLTQTPLISLYSQTVSQPTLLHHLPGCNHSGNQFLSSPNLRQQLHNSSQSSHSHLHHSIPHQAAGVIVLKGESDHNNSVITCQGFSPQIR